MSRTIERQGFAPVRMLPKDLGVALALLLALTLGGLLRYYWVDGNTRTFQDPGSPFRLAYPRTWASVAAPEGEGALLRVEDPLTDSAFKTTLTVEGREIDPASPPTLQTLVDRRIEQHGALAAYRLLASDEATVDGARGARLEYGYVVQPIDAPRRASLPVVVQAREYVIVAPDRTYYITLAAPQHEYEAALARFERIIDGVHVR